jgi:hypothetical protein
MSTFLQRFRRFREEHLAFQYFTLVFTHWQAVLWGPSVLAVIWGMHFIVGTGTPPEWVNWTAVVLALFVAGYYTWRSDHVRLVPKFEVREFCFQDTPTIDPSGRATGTSTWLQLLPKCLTEADVEQCQGHLRRILRWSNSNGWEESQMNETVLLYWSHEDAIPPMPLTLHPGIERRLNVFFVHSSNNLITPTVFPMPLRAATMFQHSSLDEVNAFLFDIKITAKDCADVDVLLRVQTSNDPFHPFIEIVDGTGSQNTGLIPSSHIS